MADTVKPLIQAGLESQILLPSDPEYAACQASYWSHSAKLAPACTLRPRSALDVSSAIKTLVAEGQKFAIRSGGHTQYAGGNNIDGGVTIDLGLLDWTLFDKDTETVNIGPGGRWKDVYGKLREHGRVVAGGRDGNVGVAGVLLGGGKTFFVAKRGFACDDVLAYEVVLADGSIVTATADQNEDLFRALKGGSNNFGIVTGFKMKAIECDAVWAGLNFFPKQLTADAAQALIRFTDNVHKDPNSHLLFFFTYLDVVIVAAYVQLEGVENAPAYNDFLAMPAVENTTKLTTIDAVVSEYDIAPQDYYNIFFTASVKNDACIVAKAAELHESLPLPKFYGQLSAQAGGNIMGISSQPVNGLLFVAVVMVRTPGQEAFVYPKVKASCEALKEFAARVDQQHGNLDWVYMNYADKSQNVLGSYGVDNVDKMRRVAVKYDPQQVFQKLCPGGFKISHVK